MVNAAHQRRYLEGFEERLQSWFNNCKIAIDNAHMESCCAITVLHWYVVNLFLGEEVLTFQRTGPWKLGPLDSQSETLSGEPRSSASEPLITQLRGYRQQGVPDDLSDSPVKNQLQMDEGRPDTESSTTRLKMSLTDYATPASSVSAFCRAVLRKLIPPQFYGTGQHKITNRTIVSRHVDRFVRMRRFESLSIHEVCKGIKVRLPNAPYQGLFANTTTYHCRLHVSPGSTLRQSTARVHHKIRSHYLIYANAQRYSTNSYITYSIQS
jgi:hypothetical protein